MCMGSMDGYHRSSKSTFCTNSNNNNSYKTNPRRILPHAEDVRGDVLEYNNTTTTTTTYINKNNKTNPPREVPRKEDVPDKVHESVKIKHN